MTNYFISRVKILIKKFFDGVSILIKIFILILILSIFLAIVLPFIYTPPALTKHKLEVYTKCINFLTDHPEYHQITILDQNDIIVEDEGRFFVDKPKSRKRLTKYFKDKDIVEIQKLSKLLNKISCLKVTKIDNMILFYTYANLILPDSPGVLYSLDQKEPNKFNASWLNPYKPFLKITDNWYFSRHLIIRWNRNNSPIPKSLIDRTDSKTALSTFN